LHGYAVVCKLILLDLTTLDDTRACVRNYLISEITERG
jgi:hypothetical protein